MTLKRKETILTGVLIYAVSGFLFYMTKGLPSDAALFPRACLILFAILDTILLALELGKKKSSSEGEGITWETVKMPLLAFLGITVYVVLFRLIGYFPATAVMLAGFMWVMKVRPWWKIACIMAGYGLFIYLMFVLWLRVSIV